MKTVNSPLLVLTPGPTGLRYLASALVRIGLGAAFLMACFWPLFQLLETRALTFPGLPVAGISFAAGFLVVPVSIHSLSRWRVARTREFRFFDDRFEFWESGSLQTFRSLGYDRLKEVVLHRPFGSLGRPAIVLCSSESDESRLASGIRLEDLSDPRSALRELRELLREEPQASGQDREPTALRLAS